MVVFRKPSITGPQRLQTAGRTSRGLLINSSFFLPTLTKDSESRTSGGRRVIKWTLSLIWTDAEDETNQNQNEKGLIDLWGGNEILYICSSENRKWAQGSDAIKAETHVECLMMNSSSWLWYNWHLLHHLSQQWASCLCRFPLSRVYIFLRAVNQCSLCRGHV